MIDAYYLETALRWWLLSCLVYLALRLIDWACPERWPIDLAETDLWDFKPLRYSPDELFSDLQRIAYIEAFRADMLRQHGKGAGPEVQVWTGYTFGAVWRNHLRQRSDGKGAGPELETWLGEAMAADFEKACQDLRANSPILVRETGMADQDC